MSDDVVAETVQCYRNASTTPSGEYPAKTEAVAALERALPHPAARAFLIDILRDPSEYDLARVEVCKLLETRDTRGLGDAEEWAAALLNVVEQEPDVLVRQWAARALRNFVLIPRVVDGAIRLIQDRDADLDVRHNALAAIEAADLDAPHVASLKAVLTDPDLGASVRRALEHAKQDT